MRSLVDRIGVSLRRLEDDLRSDLRIVLTTRPPAIAGQQERLAGFTRLPIAPLTKSRISSYVKRWLSVQLSDLLDRQEVRTAFERRKSEPHVEALIKNPMQLSVLLHFIRIRGEAFPDRRAELYHDYFQIVINRDVEKSPALRKQRSTIEALHQFLGYTIHALSEAEQADGALDRTRLLAMVGKWLEARDSDPQKALELFGLGEERLVLCDM